MCKNACKEQETYSEACKQQETHFENIGKQTCLFFLFSLRFLVQGLRLSWQSSF